MNMHMHGGFVREGEIATTAHEHSRNMMLLVHVRSQGLVAYNLKMSII